MSFFKRTFEKAKKTIEKGFSEADKAVNKGFNEIGKVTDKGKGVDELEKAANLSKEGLEKAGDFLLNSSDREYWNKEISLLKNRLNQLQEQLNNKINDYYNLRLNYQEKFYQYLAARKDTIALGLISSKELEKVTDIAGKVVGTTRRFSESNSEVEEIGRYALGFVSGGISDIILASQEADKEAEHLRKQVSQLEESLGKINKNIANHKEGIALINQSVTEILQLYGDDTTIENFVLKQCKLLVEQGKKAKVEEIIIRMQERGLTQEEILEATRDI